MVEIKTINEHIISTQIFSSSKICTTAVRTDRGSLFDLQEQTATVKRRKSICPYYLENENESISGIASDVQKWNADGCARPFMSTRMGSK